MPFRRRLKRFIRRGGYKRKFTFKHRTNRGARPELKVVDQNIFQIAAQANLAVNTGTFLLNGSKNGAGFWQRVGSRIAMKSIELVITFIYNAGGTPDPMGTDYRIALVYDAQTNGIIPTFGSIFQQFDETGAGTVTIFSGVNMPNRSRFLVLKEWRYSSLVEGTGATTPEQFVQARLPGSLHWFKKLNGLETIYSQTSVGDVTDIETGSLLLMFYASGHSISATPQIRINVQSRLRFYD